MSTGCMGLPSVFNHKKTHSLSIAFPKKKDIVDIQQKERKK